MLSAIYLFTLSFLAGNLLSMALPTLPEVPAVALLLFAALLFCRPLKVRLLGTFCLGLWWTLYSASPHSVDKPTAHWEGETLAVVGEVATIPIHKSGRTQFILNILEVCGDESAAQSAQCATSCAADDTVPCAFPRAAYFPKRVRVAIYRHSEELQITDLLHAKVKLKAAHGLANPNTFDYEKWLAMNGLEATGYIISYQKLAGAAAAYGIAQWRQRLFNQLRALRAQFPHVDSIAAITLGLASLLSYQQREILTATGTHHLYAVSGLHIGLIFGFFFVLIERLWRYLLLQRFPYPARDVALIGALPAAIAYAALAGFSVPTQRALLMLLCIVCAALGRRQIALLQSLAVALLLILIYDPQTTLSMSFWLSFTAVAMIAFFLLIMPNLRGWKLWFGMHAYLSTVMIMPTLVFFDYGALIAPLANMIVVPLTAFLVLPCSLLAVSSLSFSESLGVFFLRIADRLFEWLWQINARLADITVDYFYALETWHIAFVLAAILLFLALKQKTLRMLSLLLLFPLVPALDTPPPIASGAFRVVFFDVGQGLSVLVQTQRHNLIYDTGPSYSSGFNTADSVILPYLRAQRINTIDTLIVSHNDNDHAGSAAALLAASMPRQLLSGEPLTVGKHTFARCQRGQSWRWDDVLFEILYPPIAGRASGNNASCVLRISNRKHSLLLTADIEKEAERVLLAYPPAASDVMLIPHHGSRTSSTPELIDAVSPTLAVVTSGYRNRFSLPKADVIARYYARGIQVLDTSRSGALTVDFPPDAPLELQAYRTHNRPYWRYRPDSLWPPGEVVTNLQ